ncbi:Dabb family protein [Erwiniaceae bacterium CAU 1747]
MHIVLFKFKKKYSWASMESIEAERSTRGHIHHIDQIKGWTCGRNTTRRDIASDFVVIGLFENRQALESYIIHPDHQKGVEKWKSISEWQVVDIQLDSNFTLNSGLLSVFNSLPTAL